MNVMTRGDISDVSEGLLPHAGSRERSVWMVKNIECVIMWRREEVRRGK
jgi:hypothetical protein